MKITYDKEVDAAYVYLSESIRDGESERTIQLNDNIILDFDKNGKLLGVEILDASKILSKEVIVKAQQI